MDRSSQNKGNEPGNFDAASHLTDSIASLNPEGAYRVLSRANSLEETGREIIHLEIGQPEYPTFPNVTLAGIRAISQGETAYNPSRGIRELREAAAERLTETRQLEVNPPEIVVGPGAKPLLFLVTLALLEEGDEALYPDPGFPTYRSMIEVAGGEPVPVPLYEVEDGFRLDLDALSTSLGPDSKLLVVNTPGNPAGNLLSKEELRKLSKLAGQHNLLILSDEIYSDLVYEDQVHRTIASLPGMKERTILVDGFSKTYSMTGWRLGYAALPASLAQKIGHLLTHSVGCTATFTQHAGVEALQGPQEMVKANLTELRKKRDLLVQGLNEIGGVSCSLPGGAFYAFPNVSSFELAESKLADYLLEEVGVAVLPGTAFGPGGKGYLRLCYSLPKAKLTAALKKMEEGLSNLKRSKS
ncbi:MAG: pyridoxal phosphate-dependent aminotransferase [Candidatus Bipolaricaulota bacterium]